MPMLLTSSLAVSLLMSAVWAFYMGLAAAQEYPSRPVSLIVPNSPGSTPDSVARIISIEMSKFLGQPIVVENKPGAGYKIGYEYVAKHMPADGYTIATVFVSSLAMLPVTEKELTFDPLKDLPPVIGLVEGRFPFGSSSKLPWKTFNEMISYAKANPGKLNYGITSPQNQLLIESIIRERGVNITRIPYSAAGPYMQALVGGEIEMGFVGEANALSFGDKFRVLAVSGEHRRAPFLDVPTFKELGFPQIRGISFSLNVRAGTSKLVVDKLYAAATNALQQAGVKASLANIKLEVTNQRPAVAAKNLAEEAKFLADMAKKLGIRPE